MDAGDVSSMDAGTMARVGKSGRISGEKVSAMCALGGTWRADGRTGKEYDRG